MAYDRRRLDELGRKHRKLRDELERLRPELADEIRAAHANGVRQVDIVEATGYTRELVRRICLDSPAVTLGGRGTKRVAP